MRIRLAILTTALILAFSAINATAVPLKVSFTGSVSVVPAEVASAFNVGDPASGSYFIDSNTPDVDPDPDIGLYIGPTDFTYQFGSYVATAVGGSPGDAVGVFNDATTPGLSGDRFQTNAVNPSGADVNGYFLANLTLLLLDSTGTVFTSDALPTSLDIADFDRARAQLIFQHASLPSANVFADLSSITIAPIPESPIALLIGTGLIGLIGIARRKKSYLIKR